jgi:hypothetical protein
VAGTFAVHAGLCERNPVWWLPDSPLRTGEAPAGTCEGAHAFQIQLLGSSIIVLDKLP